MENGRLSRGVAARRSGVRSGCADRSSGRSQVLHSETAPFRDYEGSLECGVLVRLRPCGATAGQPSRDESPLRVCRRASRADPAEAHAKRERRLAGCQGRFPQLVAHRRMSACHATLCKNIETYHIELAQRVNRCVRPCPKCVYKYRTETGIILFVLGHSGISLSQSSR